MNELIVVVLLVHVAGGSAGSGIFRLEEGMCTIALAPTVLQYQRLHHTTATCIAAQGLGDIIDALLDQDENTKHLQCGGNIDVASILEDNRYHYEAIGLRECIATDMDMLTGDGTYDMEALRANILAKVAGLPIEANTQHGLDNCAAVVEANVTRYLQCIRIHCVSTAARQETTNLQPALAKIQ